MRGNKRLVQGIAVASMTGALVFSALPQQPIMQTEETIQMTQNGTAAAVMSDEYINEIFTQALSIEKNDAYQVAASAVAGKSVIEKPAIIEKDRTEKKKSASKNTEKDTKKETAKKETKKEASKEKKTETKKKADKSDQKAEDNKLETKKANTKNQDQTEKNKKDSDENKKDKKVSEKDKWTNKLMADVDKSLNIRKSDNIDAEVLGKLRKGDVAKVLKKGKKWTKVKSGSVTGYVKNNYCVYGDKAYKLANKVCDTLATVKADGLRIRQKADEDATILRAVEEGDKLVVNTDKKEKDGWVAVQVNDTKGYVSSDYVDVALGTGKAITIEEEQAQIAASQKAAQEAAAQTAAANSQSTNTAPAVSQSVQVSPSDLTLLSAIIFCEAGGESYAGQVAVGAVVMNRVKSSSYPNSIYGVVYQSGQFSPVANGSLSRALSNGNYTHCISAAQAALAGSDNTGGAKFFHRVNGDAGLVIGNHVFY